MSRLRRHHRHREHHLVSRVGWMRAAVLGANDGIVSTTSLIIGVAAASAATGDILIAGAAGLVAGAMSMAAGEYVSVSSQADTERADILREEEELASNIDAERQELAHIYIGRGIEPGLAIEVADQLMEKDALAAHAQDELGITGIASARPVQAALTSAATFSAGAALPLAAALLSPRPWLIAIEAVAALVFLATLGAIGARIGGAPVLPAVVRVTFWSSLAMALTAVVGRLAGSIV